MNTTSENFSNADGALFFLLISIDNSKDIALICAIVGFFCRVSSRALFKMAKSAQSLDTKLKLNDGVEIPLFGLGMSIYSMQRDVSPINWQCIL